MSVEGIDTVHAIDRMLTVFDQQQGINEKMLAMVAAWDELDDLRAADIQELREGMAALSNRLEGLTRYVMDAEAGQHSVKA
jgi:tRNA(Phe) wybutosine-synthesizing methylase Tyw3